MTNSMKEYLIKQVSHNREIGAYVGHIVLSNINRASTFEERFPEFDLYRSTKNERQYINSDTGGIWITIVPNKCNCHGRRFYKVVIDSTIDDKLFTDTALLCTIPYCYDMRFFE